MTFEELEAAWGGLAWEDHEGQIDVPRRLLGRPDDGDAGDEIPRYELWEELHQHLRALERYDEAIEAKRSAIAAGYRSVPDPEADIAEMYVAQGRLDDAADLYTELRSREPDDAWLYNSAAWAYRVVDPYLSLDWALDGVAVALDTGDPDQVITQLLEWAQNARTTLGLPPDADVEAEVTSFVAAWQPPTAEGFDGSATINPGNVTGRVADLLRELRGDPHREIVLSWVPAHEWPRALEQWPELFIGTSNHDEYRRRIESKAKAMNKVTPGRVRHIAVLTVDDVIAFAAQHDLEDDWFAARSQLAGAHVRSGTAMPWPPKRNDRCWCGSGQKYKRCCEPVPAAPIET